MSPQTPHVEIADRFAIVPEELLYDAAIPAEAVRVYGVLLRYGSDPANCYPSHATIAGHIGKSARSVPAWIRTLEEAGWVDRVARKSPEGDPTSNGYRVYGRARERGVRASERGPLPAEERAPSAPDSAPKETHGNETQPEGDLELVGAAPSAESVLAAGFDRFWEVWPRKAAKGEARKAWPAAVKAAGSIDVLVDGARRYRDDPNRDDRYTAHPATWLRAERWNDEPLPTRAGRPAQQRRIIEDRDGPSGRIDL